MNRRLDYVWGILVLIGLWQIGSWLGGPNAIASPYSTLVTLFGEAETPRFWRNVGASSFRIMAALCISFVVAVPLGLFLGSSRRADRIARPLIYLTYPVPKIVFLPLALLIFGLGDLSKIMMLALILFFQLLITTRDAARGVNRSAKHSLLSLGGNRLDLFIHVIWPATLPAIFTALRIAT